MKLVSTGVPATSNTRVVKTGIAAIAREFQRLWRQFGTTAETRPRRFKKVLPLAVEVLLLIGFAFARCARCRQ